MAKTFQYCVAENWGKGFIDHNEAIKISFSSFPGNVWQVPAYHKHANLWIAKVSGTIKTLAEAQTIVDAEVTTAQNTWDGDNVEGETTEQKEERLGSRPADITLTE